MSPLLGIGLGVGTSALSSLLGDDQKLGAQNARLRSRMTGLAGGLLDEASLNPTDRAGYRYGMADAREGLREQADDDAGRAAARGLSGGRAVAAGAKSRSTTLARLQRALLSNEAGRTSDLKSRAYSMLMGVEGLNQQDANRRTAQQGQWLGGLATLGGTLAPLLIPGASTSPTA